MPPIAALAAAAATTARAPARQPLHPLLIVVLCAVAGVATWLALPGQRKIAIARICGLVILIAFVILAAMLVHYAQGYGHGGMGVYFWIFSGIAIFGAFRVITHPRPVYSALYFVLTVMASAGLFVLMWAEFMAAALVVIYAGAILVTYVFVIMLAAHAQTGPATAQARPLSPVADYDRVSRDPLVASLIGFALMAVLLFAIFDKAQGAIPPTVTPPPVSTQFDGTVQALGRYLMTDQLVNLELAGLILTIAMVGAIVIARRRIVMSHGVQELVETPEPEVISKLPPEMTYDDPRSIPVFGTNNPAVKVYPER
jgi:NADH-quinone oxidoreductase subunit J